MSPVQYVRDVTGPYPGTPTPPTLWKSFFGPPISRNMHTINTLHFGNVNESVAATPDFAHFLAQKAAF
jgi:hypothetical protein